MCVFVSVFGSYTMDVIAGTAFGLETNSQTQEGEPFVMHSKKLFENTGGRFRSIIIFFFSKSLIETVCGRIKIFFFFFCLFSCLFLILGTRKDSSKNYTDITKPK